MADGLSRLAARRGHVIMVTGRGEASANAPELDFKLAFDARRFSPLEAIKISTLNGANYLGRDAKIGSIAIGKQADLVLVAGDPSNTIADVRKVDTVFRKGVGYDPQKLTDSVKGKMGIW